MKRILTIVAGATLLLLAATSPVAATAIAENETNTNTTENETITANETNGLSLGAQISGMIAAQETELNGELESRTFGSQIASATNDTERANIIGERVSNISERVQNLQEERQELLNERKAGNISQTEFHVRMSQLVAEKESLQNLVNQSSNATEALPSGLQNNANINTTALAELRNQTENVSGPEIAAIAQDLHANNKSVNKSHVDRGPPEQATNTEQNDSDKNKNASGDSDRTRGPPEDRGPNTNTTDGDDSDAPESETTTTTTTTTAP